SDILEYDLTTATPAPRRVVTVKSAVCGVHVLDETSFVAGLWQQKKICVMDREGKVAASVTLGAGREDWVRALAASGDLLLVGLESGKIHMLSTPRLETLWTDEWKGLAASAAISPSGRFAAAGMLLGNARRWTL